MTVTTEVCTKAFGGILQSDSYGFYSAMEFLSLASGCWKEYGTWLPSCSTTDTIATAKISHDYARRVAWQPAGTGAVDLAKCFDDSMPAGHREVIQTLLQTMAIPVPGRRKASTWNNSHFYPYSESSIHWDARLSRNNINVERIYYRGAGALALRILRSDSNNERREEIDKNLQRVFSDEDVPQSPLMTLLHDHDEHTPSVNNTPDEVEKASTSRDDIFEENLREGLKNLLSHSKMGLPRTSIIDSVLHYIPFSLARLQHGRAHNFVNDSEENPLPLGIVDCGTQPGQLRRASKRTFENASTLITACLRSTAEQVPEDGPPTQSQLNQFTSYFTRTAGAIGLLNATFGVRHFALSDSLLETLVLAETTANSKTELTFSDFCDALFEHWGLVIDHRSANSAGFLVDIDTAVFEDNADRLAHKMKQLGFLVEYSDHTRMVRYGF